LAQRRAELAAMADEFEEPVDDEPEARFFAVSFTCFTSD
jgi:hypothetical protein